MNYTKASHGYIIEAKLLDETNKELYDISETIQTVMVKKAFMKNSFPLYVFDIRCTEAMRDVMRDNTVSVKLKISYYNLDDILNSELLDTSEVVEQGIIFDGIIRIYDKPFTTTLAKHDEDNPDDLNSQSNSAPFVFYRMSGIPEDLLTKNETSVNAVYKNCDLADAAVHLLTEADTYNPIYMQETKNKKIYPFILIPPVSLVPAIKFIDDNYMRLYEHPASLFIDSDGMYLYDPLSKSLPKTNRLEIRVLNQSMVDDLESSLRPGIDSENNIQIIYRTLPAFNKSTELVSHELGSHTIFYYYDDNFNLVSIAEDNQESYNKNRYIWERIADKSIKTINNDKSMALTISNLNPELINPLTVVSVISQDYPDATGEYGIVECSYIFSSNDGKHYTSLMSIQTIKK